MVTTRVGHLVTVPGHAAWACSELLTRGERAPAGEEGAPARGGGGGAQRWAPDLQSSPAYRPKTLLQSTLGDLNSPTIYKAYLINIAIQV